MFYAMHIEGKYFNLDIPGWIMLPKQATIDDIHDCILKVIFFNLNLLFDKYLMEQKCLFHLSHFVSSF